MPLFHLAINVTDLNEARAFYGGVLGCTEGRCSETWVDYDFFGHQLTLHLGEPLPARNTGKVDGKNVPIPHFGVVMNMDDWQVMADRLTQAGVEFALAPCRRFEGKAGDQRTLFIYDPFSNPIEIKGVTDLDDVFAS